MGTSSGFRKRFADGQIFHSSESVFKNVKAETTEEVLFITVQAWGALAKSCLEYLSKGRGVREVGRLRQERWTDKDGGNRERIVVVAEHVEFKKEPNATSQTEQAQELEDLD